MCAHARTCACMLLRTNLIQQIVEPDERGCLKYVLSFSSDTAATEWRQHLLTAGNTEYHAESRQHRKTSHHSVHRTLECHVACQWGCKGEFIEGLLAQLMTRNSVPAAFFCQHSALSSQPQLLASLISTYLSIHIFMYDTSTHLSDDWHYTRSS